MQDADPTTDAALQQHRPRWRAYLLLSRVSNLPTVWSNVLAGLTAGASLDGLTHSHPRLGILLLSVSAFYTGGMFLNDAFDATFDRASRPERPIPRGDVSGGEVFAVGAGLLAFGIALLSPHRSTMGFGGLLAAAIVLYDAWHKKNAFAPIVMGACRGLVYLLAASTVALTQSAWVGAAVMVAYVASLTIVAKRAGRDARWLVPTLIAGISIVDAVFILTIQPNAVATAAMAALGFPLTLSLQRWVPGD